MGTDGIGKVSTDAISISIVTAVDGLNTQIRNLDEVYKRTEQLLESLERREIPQIEERGPTVASAQCTIAELINSYNNRIENMSFKLSQNLERALILIG